MNICELVTGKKHEGFTLVELMVVISIIALLIAILLPALSKARMAAQGTICLSKERQQGLAISMYADAHHGWMVVISEKLDNKNPYWPVILVNQGYLGSEADMGIYRDFTCPTQAFLGQPSLLWRSTNYGLNYRFADYGGNHGRMFPFGRGYRNGATGELTDFWMAKDSPSDVALLADYYATSSGRPSIRINTNPVSTNNRISFRHNGESSNILYFDLHAGARNRESVSTDLSSKFWIGGAY